MIVLAAKQLKWEYIYLITPTTMNQFGSSVHHRLQTAMLVGRFSSESGITKIQPRLYHWDNQRLKDRIKHWPSNCTKLSLLGERVVNQPRHSSLRGDVTADENCKVANAFLWRNMVSPDSYFSCWQLLLLSWHGAPNDFGLRCNQLEAVVHNPLWPTASTCWEILTDFQKKVSKDRRLVEIWGSRLNHGALG